MTPTGYDNDDLSDSYSLSDTESFQSAFSKHTDDHSHVPSTHAWPPRNLTQSRSHSPSSSTARQGRKSSESAVQPLIRFPPTEEAELLGNSNTHKATGNDAFTSGSYQTALDRYNEALEYCPNYLDYELAVLRSNMSACWLKLGEWKKAEEDAGIGISKLKGLGGAEEAEAKLEKVTLSPNGEDQKMAEARVQELPDDEDESNNRPKENKEQATASTSSRKSKAAATSISKHSEIDPESEAATAAQNAFRLGNLTLHSHDTAQVLRLRTKLTLRHAHALSQQPGWSSLGQAVSDYQFLSSLPTPLVLSPLDRSTVQKALRELPEKVEAAKTKEIGDMMGKLKDLGNGILKPFGLSTDNFNFVKDGTSGGYSMQFNQGKKS